MRFIRLEPQYRVHWSSIESVNKIFLLFALRGLNWDANLHPPSYHSTILLINLPTLKNRWTILSVVFIQYLLARFIFKVYWSTKNCSVLFPSQWTQEHEPLSMFSLYHIISISSLLNLKTYFINFLRDPPNRSHCLSFLLSIYKLYLSCGIAHRSLGREVGYVDYEKKINDYHLNF